MWLTEVDNWWYKPNNISLCLFCFVKQLTILERTFHIVWIYIMVGYTRSVVNYILIITSSLFQWNIHMCVVAEPDNAIKKEWKVQHTYTHVLYVPTFASGVFEWNILLEHDIRSMWQKSNIGCPIWRIQKQCDERSLLPHSPFIPIGVTKYCTRLTINF